MKKLHPTQQNGKKKLVGGKIAKSFNSNRSISIRSRHPSTSVLRQHIFWSKKAVYRHGSTSNHGLNYEINTKEAVQNSASKLRMKECFDQGKVKHLPWMRLSKAKLQNGALTDGKITINFPVVIKQHFGSRGKGNYKVDTPEQFTSIIKGKNLADYLVETYFSGAVEFRVHITAYGPIYCLRKLLKENVPKEKRWVRNDSTCVWITEFTQNKQGKKFLNFTGQDSPTFGKPRNWKEIIDECKKALRSIGGDLLAVDIKAQSNVDSKGRARDRVDFYILEVNSAPSIGEITGLIYKKELPKILDNKYGNLKN